MQEAEDIVSAAIMAAVLEERQRETRHCATCTCGGRGEGVVGGGEGERSGGRWRGQERRGEGGRSVGEGYDRGRGGGDSPGDETDELVAKLLELRLQCESMQGDVSGGDQSVDSGVEACVCGVKPSSGSNVIDVGTQTVPSYIGESGKVHSTCIYCKALKSKGRLLRQQRGKTCMSDAESVGSEVSCYGSEKKSPDRVSSACSWDWSPQGCGKMVPPQWAP